MERSPEACDLHAAVVRAFSESLWRAAEGRMNAQRREIVSGDDMRKAVESYGGGPLIEKGE